MGHFFLTPSTPRVHAADSIPPHLSPFLTGHICSSSSTPIFAFAFTSVSFLDLNPTHHIHTIMSLETTLKTPATGDYQQPTGL